MPFGRICNSSAEGYEFEIRDSQPSNYKFDGTDYIRELAETVTVKGGEQEQELFYQYLRKWLVAMVAAWVDETVVNNVILVLIGE